MNAANYGGANDWRYWSALNSDGTGPNTGYNRTGSELGHLFYTEGGLSSGQNITSSTALSSAFSNMQNDVYWSSTPAGSFSWVFLTDDGYQTSGFGGAAEAYGWAVRPGQIPAVPLPGTALLMALGLVGLGARRAWRRGSVGHRSLG
jgi:hypothetical protein